MRSPLPRAETFPRFPPGMTMTSGACQSNCCTISMPTVFCPSILREFMELARYRVSSLVISCTTRMQPSKSVSSESTREPFAIGWTSWAMEIFPRGSSTIDGIPAAAQ